MTVLLVVLEIGTTDGWRFGTVTTLVFTRLTTPFEHRAMMLASLSLRASLKSSRLLLTVHSSTTRALTLRVATVWALSGRARAMPMKKTATKETERKKTMTTKPRSSKKVISPTINSTIST
ncbi:MAG: hypothetical protein AAGA21_22310 [Pseudomonadota bacterium]